MPVIDKLEMLVIALPATDSDAGYRPFEVFPDHSTTIEGMLQQCGPAGAGEIIERGNSLQSARPPLYRWGRMRPRFYLDTLDRFVIGSLVHRA